MESSLFLCLFEIGEKDDVIGDDELEHLGELDVEHGDEHDDDETKLRIMLGFNVLKY